MNKYFVTYCICIFRNVHLQNFYFDIRKDVLYCDPLESKKRKSTLTLLNIILNSLLRLFDEETTFADKVFKVFKFTEESTLKNIASQIDEDTYESNNKKNHR